MMFIKEGLDQNVGTYRLYEFLDFELAKGFALMFGGISVPIDNVYRVVI